MLEMAAAWLEVEGSTPLCPLLGEGGDPAVGQPDSVMTTFLPPQAEETACMVSTTHVPAAEAST